MVRILTCTWAPTATTGPQLLKQTQPGRPARTGEALRKSLLAPVQHAEALGINYLLVAQRWYGTGREIEGSTYDCLAMTAYYAAQTERIRLVTAIHPGFFLPGPIAKWGATIDAISDGRWCINVTSGWHEQEFPMYGAALLPHDERYERATEFIDVVRGAWETSPFDYHGRHYQVEGLELDPRPVSPAIEVFQGGQSEAARNMAASHSDWMFLNGGPPEKIASIVRDVHRRESSRQRPVNFAMYAIPLCRATDAEAEAEVAAMVARIDPETITARRQRVQGAHGMWAESPDPLTMLDSNEGFAARLIGSPETVYRRMMEFHELGVGMFHLTLNDPLFVSEVLPRIQLHT
jgi:FMNH2-dependent dimethyl sulfone monooxygenase